MKKGIFLLLFVLLTLVGKAQQKALYSQYMTNHFILNPAAAGAGKDLNMKLGYRNQWVGFEGAPQTYYLSGESALFQNKRGRRRRRGDHGFHGAGGYIYKDKTGPTSRTGALLAYAYHLPVADKVYLSGGLFAGLQQYNFDESFIHLANGSNDADPITQNGSSNSFLPDLSLGTMLYSKSYYVSIALFQVLGNKILKFDNSENPARLARHLFMSGGYNFEVNKSITVTPSLLLKYVSPVPVQADFNVVGTYNLNNRRKTDYDDKIWAGLSYRTQDALVGLIGFKFLEQYELSYSYDITTSAMRQYSSGSHEIMFGYRVKR